MLARPPPLSSSSQATWYSATHGPGRARQSRRSTTVSPGDTRVEFGSVDAPSITRASAWLAAALVEAEASSVTWGKVGT